MWSHDTTQTTVSITDELSKLAKLKEQRRLLKVQESGFPAFENRQYVNELIEEYRFETDYFDIDYNDKIGLTDREKRYCNDRR